MCPQLWLYLLNQQISANKSISRLHNVNHLVSLSPEDELDIKNKGMCWVCNEKFV